jgi:hypothetical protein
MRRVASLLAAVTVAVAGCGSGTSVLLHGSRRRASAGASDPADKVIRGWADALRGGDVRGAARYFQIPSVFFAGDGPPLRIRSHAQAEAVNAALPCGAKLISTHRIGRYVNALFRLTDRSGRGGQGGCGSGAGQTARTNFLIEDGLIVQWLRAPDQPGDNGMPRHAPGPGTGTAPAPTTPTSPDTTPGGGTPLA